MQKTKLNELLEFPCQFPYKVIGKNDPNLAKHVLEIVKKYAPGTYSPQEKISGKSSYRSVSIIITAKDIEQVETLYKELAKIDGVKMVL